MSEITASALDTFSSNRLIATRLRAEHLVDYRRLFQNVEVVQMLTPDGRQLTDDETARWVEFSLQHWERYGFGYWVWHTRSDSQFVGRAGLKCNSFDGEDVVELGYALLPEFWGQGFATEMAESILKLAFTQLDWDEVVCYTLANNAASRRVMEKAGFQIQRETNIDGVPHVFSRLTKTNWQTRTSGKRTA